MTPPSAVTCNTSRSVSVSSTRASHSSARPSLATNTIATTKLFTTNQQAARPHTRRQYTMGTQSGQRHSSRHDTTTAHLSQYTERTTFMLTSLGWCGSPSAVSTVTPVTLRARFPLVVVTCNGSEEEPLSMWLSSRAIGRAQAWHRSNTLTARRPGGCVAADTSSASRDATRVVSEDTDPKEAFVVGGGGAATGTCRGVRSAASAPDAEAAAVARLPPGLTGGMGASILSTPTGDGGGGAAMRVVTCRTSQRRALT